MNNVTVTYFGLKKSTTSFYVRFSAFISQQNHVLIILTYFSNCHFQRSVEIYYNSPGSYLNVMSNSLEKFYFLVKGGKINFTGNNFKINNKGNEISLLKSQSLNITNNVFEENLVSPIYSKEYITVQKSIDRNINEVINIEDTSQRMIVQGNIHKLKYIVP